MSLAVGIIFVHAMLGQALRPQVLDEAEARPVVSDEVAVTMQPGHGPGRYHFRTTPGDPYRPQYFAVDFEGAVFVLDSEQEGVQVFSHDGTFRRFVELSLTNPKPRTFGDPLFGVYPRGPVGVTADQRIYVVFAGKGYDAIARFNPDGQCEALLGNEGPIPREDWEAAMLTPSIRTRPYAGPEAFGGVYNLFACPDGSLLFLAHRSKAPKSEPFLYDPKTGRIEVSSVSAEALRQLQKKYYDYVKGVAKRAEALQGKAKRDWEDARRRDVLLAPDGCLYYMTVFPDVLEVHRVRFEDTSQPSE